MSDGWINSLVHYFSADKEERPVVPEGACPNCWGHYEYDNMVRNIIRDKQVDVQNHVATRSFIQDFVVNHVDGVRLRNEDGIGRCPRCGKVFNDATVHEHG